MKADGLNLDPWWDEPAYKGLAAFLLRQGGVILRKLEAYDSAKLKDVLSDVYRDAVPEPAVHHQVPMANNPRLHWARVRKKSRTCY